MKSKRRAESAVDNGAEQVASATECTGMMPALAQDEAQAGAEAALLDIHSARGARGDLPDERTV